MVNKTAGNADEVYVRHRYNTRESNKKSRKRKAPTDWAALKEQGEKRQRQENDSWRRKDSVTHLIASIYADVETAADLQRRMGARDGTTATPISDNKEESSPPIVRDIEELELPNFEIAEDIRLDYLRELRVAEMFTNADERKSLMRAALPRGKRFNSIRAMRDVASNMDAPRWDMLIQVVNTLGWTTLAICLHSANFQTRFLDLVDAVDFPQRLEQIQSQQQALEFFASSRRFVWLEETAEQQAQDVLFGDLRRLLAGTATADGQEANEEETGPDQLRAQPRIVGLLPEDNARVDHPHEWELSANGAIATRLKFTSGQGTSETTRLQENMEQSEVLIEGQQWGKKSKWLLPREPRFRTSDDGECLACGEDDKGEGKSWRANCQCQLENLRIKLAADGVYFGNRVELRHSMNPVMGTGVRALQRLPANSLLAEYAGEIYPAAGKYKGKGLYDSNMYLLKERRKHPGINAIEMYVDPCRRGNWTRYINHSCKPKTAFLRYACGEKIVTCVTVRDESIELGDEITIDYGRDYFTEQNLACLCGEDECTLWNADKVKRNKITLRDAKQRGIAPE